MQFYFPYVSVVPRANSASLSSAVRAVYCSFKLGVHRKKRKSIQPHFHLWITSRITTQSLQKQASLVLLIMSYLLISEALLLVCRLLVKISAKLHVNYGYQGLQFRIKSVSILNATPINHAIDLAIQGPIRTVIKVVFYV